MNGPMIVIAGAGSGKTRVLTYKIAYLMTQGVDPFNILALTFTNKAAKEMKERIANIVGDEAKNLWMGTFHSVFARILRIEAHKIGYTSNFTIYDYFLNLDKNEPSNIIKFNIGNEFAVNLFKNKFIKYTDIYKIIKKVTSLNLNYSVNTIKDIINYHEEIENKLQNF